VDIRGTEKEDMGKSIMRSFVTCTYFSRSIIRIIKSRRMSGAGHVARMAEKRNS
jgi:hypothetical protein